MRRRLYFLLPDREHAERIVEELRRGGISSGDINIIVARPGQGAGPPRASPWHRDPLARLERWAWTGNLALFFVALALLVVALLTGMAAVAVAMVAVMIATFVLGLAATWLPNVHLDEFGDALAHGEALMVVDAPQRRVQEIEDRIHRHHPEAVIGGVGWMVGHPGR